MFLRRVTDFILQGRAQAMGAALVSSFIPVIGGIGILIAAFVTLRKGAKEGALVMLAATVASIVYYAAPASVTQADSLVLVMAVSSNIFAWALSMVLRQFGNWSFTLEFAGLAGVVIIAIVHLIFPEVQDWWMTMIKEYLVKTTEAVANLESSAATAVTLDSAKQSQLAMYLKGVATGYATASVLLNALIQVLLARWWQAIMFNPGGLKPELQSVRLSHVIGAIFIIALVTAYLGNELALDTLPVLCIVFFIAGLSLIHSLFNLAQPKTKWLWLIAIYAGIFYKLPLGIIIVSLIALFDTGFDFRNRLIKR